MRDELAIFFENPATDPLGHSSVEGKILFAEDKVSIRFKQKDRAFRKNESQLIELTYSELESATYQSKFFGPKLLIITTRETNKLDIFPDGADAQIELHVRKDSRNQAEKVADYIEYRQSEAYLRERDEKLANGRSE